MLPYLAGALAWGFFEATLFFLLPEIFAGAAAILFPHRWWVFALEALVGSVAGTALVFALAERHEALLSRLYGKLPGQPPPFAEMVREDYRERGRRALVEGVLALRPLKLYAVESGSAGDALLPFLLWAALPRAASLFFVTLAASQAELALFGGRNTVRNAAVFVGAALLLSAAVLLRRQLRFRSPKKEAVEPAAP